MDLPYGYKGRKNRGSVLCAGARRAGRAGWGRARGRPHTFPHPRPCCGSPGGCGMWPSLLRAAHPTAPLGQCPSAGIICFRAPCLNSPRGESLPPEPGRAHLVAPPAEVLGARSRDLSLQKVLLLVAGWDNGGPKGTCFHESERKAHKSWRIQLPHSGYCWLS